MAIIPRREEKMCTGKNAVFLSGKKVLLTPVDKNGDLDKILLWTNREDVRHMFISCWPRSRQERERWYNAIDQSPDRMILMIRDLTGTALGVADLHDISYFDGTSKVGVYLGEPKSRRHGYGRDAVMLLVRYAFCELRLRKVGVDILDFNKSSIACFESCGAEQEATLIKQFFRKGEFCDCLIYAFFADKWLPYCRSYFEEDESSE